MNLVVVIRSSRVLHLLTYANKGGWGVYRSKFAPRRAKCLGMPPPTGMGANFLGGGEFPVTQAWIWFEYDGTKWIRYAGSFDFNTAPCKHPNTIRFHTDCNPRTVWFIHLNFVLIHSFRDSIWFTHSNGVDFVKSPTVPDASPTVPSPTVPDANQ